jgi:hypothetical protein
MKKLIPLFAMALTFNGFCGLQDEAQSVYEMNFYSNKRVLSAASEETISQALQNNSENIAEWHRKDYLTKRLIFVRCKFDNETRRWIQIN